MSEFSQKNCRADTRKASASLRLGNLSDTRVVFMGTPQYAADILQVLISAAKVVAVFTNPDSVHSRGKMLQPTPVKALALAQGIPVYTPHTLRSDEALDCLRELHPDVICVAAYGKILPQAVLDSAPFGAVNVHASLLPCWRGAAPIQRAILAGDETIGVSIMKMEAGLDTGPFALRVGIPGAGKSTAELTHDLAALGGEALVWTLKTMVGGRDCWQTQDDAVVTYATKLSPGELFLSPADNFASAQAKVRASDDAHPAKCVIAGKGVSVYSLATPDEAAAALLEASPLEPGQARMIARRLFMGFSDGVGEVLRIQADGKAVLSGRDFGIGLQNSKTGVPWKACE